MGGIKGRREWERFTNGESLSPRKAIKAQCYICNGFDEGSYDCQGNSCPLYQYFPYKGKKEKITTDEKAI